MSPDCLIRSLLGDRRASQYILSLPPGEFEEHLEALEIKSFVINDDDAELYRVAGEGFFPVVYLEYLVQFEGDIPQDDVLGTLAYVRKEGVVPPPRMVAAFLNQEQTRTLAMHIRIMCIGRSEPAVKRVAPKRARVVYDCRIGEQWVEIHFAKQAIPVTQQRLSA